jgi:hypothetical protein
MSTSPIGTRVPTIAPNAIIRAGIPLSDNFNATDVAVSVESLLASSGRFDVTFTGLEFRNIASAPLVIIQSNRAVIITSVAAILTEQTEAFDFSEAIIITTTASRIAQAVDDNGVLLTRNKNTILATNLSQQNPIGQGNAYITTRDENNATTGDGIVRILGTYYEIDL